MISEITCEGILKHDMEYTGISTAIDFKRTSFPAGDKYLALQDDVRCLTRSMMNLNISDFLL